MKLLVVDDDRDLVELLEYALRREGYDVARAYDGESAVELVAREKPDLVVLDINLPKLAGFVVLERIRHADEHVAVLLLSARQDESDILRGLQLGADDYITKPFRPKELVARVKAILRRSVRTSWVASSSTMSPVLYTDGAGRPRVWTDRRRIALTRATSSFGRNGFVM